VPQDMIDAKMIALLKIGSRCISTATINLKVSGFLAGLTERVLDNLVLNIYTKAKFYV